MATKWGIISAGKISHDFSSTVRSMPTTDHQIVAIAAQNLTRAQDFAKLHQIPQAYGSYEELAKDKVVEVVYVGALNRQHYDIGKLLLENGKHVLMEKPMCINLKQTQELNNLAKKKNLFLMEAMWTRFFPYMTQLETELANKTIGDIVHVNVSFGFPIVTIERLRSKNLGGGSILDLGVYAVFALLFVFGEEPVEVKTVGALNSEGVDQSVASSLLFSNKRTAQATLSLIGELPNKLEIIGTKGTIKTSERFHCSLELITPEKTYNYTLPETVLPCNYQNSSGLRYEAEVVRQCLIKGLTECPQMSHKFAEMNARLRDKWRKDLEVVFPEDQ